jgi:hypothetical protein
LSLKYLTAALVTGAAFSLDRGGDGAGDAGGDVGEAREAIFFDKWSSTVAWKSSMRENERDVRLPL